MKPSPWQKLVSLSRSAPADTTDATAPYGFSTRIVAQAFSQRPPSTENLFAKISLRALGVAALVAVVTVATNLKPVMSTLSDDVTTLADPVNDLPADTAS